MASEKQKQRATAVGSGDLLGHINVITQINLANQNAQQSTGSKSSGASTSAAKTKITAEIFRISRLRTNYRSATKPAH
jgi:hypothetical protein